MKYPLATNSWGQEEIDAIQRVIKSNHFTMGKEVRAFEEEFASYFNVPHAIMTNSGSSANLLTIAAFAFEQDPQHDVNRLVSEPKNIIVPAVSWSTTYFPVHQYGYKLKFVDVDPNTFNLTPKIVEDAIDDNTVAVFAVNLLGNPCDLYGLSNVCKRHGITLLEDNCESLGAHLHDRAAGSWGKMGTFSFFFSHHMQTMEGGMIITNSDYLNQHLRCLRAHGWIRDLPDQNYIHNKTGDAFLDSFVFGLPGYCVRPLEMSGAIGREQLKKWPGNMNWRQKNARLAKSIFNETPGVRLQEETGTSSWFGFGLVLEDHLKGKRTEVISKLTEAGVETRPIVTGNFTRQPVIDRLNYAIHSDLEASDDLHYNGFFVGNDTRDLYYQLTLVSDIIKAIK